MTEFSVPVAIHSSAALIVLLIGPVNIFRPRRDTVHRILGATWLLAMYTACVSSFFFGLDAGFTWLHGLSSFTLCSVTAGLLFIMRGNVRAHLGNMVGSYVGTLIAFVFAALVPDRLIATTLTGGNPDQLRPLLGMAATVVAIAAVWVVVVVRRWRTPRGAPVHRAGGGFGPSGFGPSGFDHPARRDRLG